MSDKNSKSRSSRRRRTSLRHRHRSRHLLKRLPITIEPVNAYYPVALPYRRYCLSERSWYHANNMDGWITGIANRLEIQLSLQMSDSSNPIRILRFLLAFRCRAPPMKPWKVPRRGSSISSWIYLPELPQRTHMLVQVKFTTAKRWTDIVESSHIIAPCSTRNHCQLWWGKRGHHERVAAVSQTAVDFAQSIRTGSLAVPLFVEYRLWEHSSKYWNSRYDRVF